MEKKLLIDSIDSLIAEAMKSKDKVRLESLKLIKTNLVKAQKDGIALTEASEGKIIQKMIKQSEDSIDQFKKGNRNDLADEESAQLEIIKQFAPEEVSEEEIRNCTKAICKAFEEDGYEVNMKLMKDIMAQVQGFYPTAPGKIISEVVRNWKK